MARFGLLWRTGWRIRPTPYGISLIANPGWVARLCRLLSVLLHRAPPKMMPPSRETDLL